jgi:undecaprenyl-diphosphatase
VAFIPAAVFGLLFSKKIDELMESALTVGITLFIGGIILLFVDKWFNKPDVKEEKEISYFTAL